MPCYSIQTMSAELALAHRETLLRALRAAGYADVRESGTTIYARTPAGARFTITDGRVEMQGEYMQQRTVDLLATNIKRAYAGEVIKAGAKKYGYTLTQDKRTPAKQLLVKRAW